MRRQLLLTVAAATLVVLVAFLLPLAWVVRSSAADRATSEATLGVQPIAAVLGSIPTEQVALVVDAVRGRLGEPVSVFLPDGTVLGDQRPLSDSVRLAREKNAFTADLPGGGREVLIPITTGTAGAADETTVIRAEIPASRLTQGVARTWLGLGVLGLVLLGIALLVADRLARSFLVPLHALTDTATRLGAGELEARVDPAGPPEVAAAGTALNRLGGRIVDLLKAEREQVADLSHRLRTPLTALRLDAESLSDGEERERLSRDVAELSRVVDQVISEVRRPVREGLVPGCDAAAVVRARLGFWEVLAEDTDRAIEQHVPSEAVPVRLVGSDLADALDAMLGNVFAHTPDGTPFRVELRPHPGGGAQLVVEDAGPGLPPVDVLARGASGGGSSGLGLDIVRRAAEASGGSLLLGRGRHGGARVAVELGAPAR